MTPKLRQLRRYLPDRAWRVFVWLSRPERRVYRVPAAVLLILGGMLAFLPILGIWMLPAGLLLLSVDMPFLQGPLVRLIGWTARQWDRLRYRWNSA